MDAGVTLVTVGVIVSAPAPVVKVLVKDVAIGLPTMSVTPVVTVTVNTPFHVPVPFVGLVGFRGTRRD